MATKQRAVQYRRVSSAQQGRGSDRNDGGWSLQSQEAKAGEYASKQNLKIVRVFEEVASASKRGRPVFAELVAYLTKHPGTALVVEKMDRLARNSRDISAVDDLVDAGVVIHLVRDGKLLHKGSSPGERLSTDIEGAVAKHYSRNLGLEVKKGIDARFADGYFPMGTPPFGYVYPPRRPGERVNIEPETKAAKTVKTIFETYARGDASFPELVKLAQRLGYKSPRGGQMSAATVQKLLRNPVYAGWVRHNGDVIKGKHTAIVTQALFDRVQAKMASRSNGRTNRPRPKMLHAFSGIFRCAACGAPMVRHQRDGGKSTAYWFCKAWCTDAKYVRETDITEQVGEHLDTLNLPKQRVDKIVAAMRSRVGGKSDQANLMDAIKREQHKRERLIDLFQDGDISKAQYKARKLESERAEAALRERVEAVQDQTDMLARVDAVAKQLDLVRDFGELWRRGDPREQQRILSLLWQTDGTERSAVDPKAKRITPAWRPIWSAFLDAGAYPQTG